ncbi:MAG: hypothetical protein R3F22_07985 [Lysobacteraceae bacterium]
MHPKIDYLVYSSHKSATQTITASLRKSGLRAIHCHFLNNIELDQTNFREWLTSDDWKSRGSRLKLISVFREPIDRHISSFFQGYGTRPIRLGEVKDETETLIYRKSLEHLQDQLVAELETRSLIGYRESVDAICDDLELTPGELKFDASHLSTLNSTPHADLHLCRFDHIVQCIAPTLSRITGRPVEQLDANVSESKWYAEKYRRFKETLRLPGRLIRDIYDEKAELLSLFYPRLEKETLNLVLRRYSD